ncbi:MAG: DNA-processing protein DprA [Vicinamibacteria bacterium]|nr:DNA-processing protein DprA [Vicinamibacteria bacterium]
MDERTLRILTLARLPGFGSRKISSLVKADGIDEVIEQPRRFTDLISEPALECLADGSARGAAEQTVKAATAKGQSIVPLGSPDYPSSLAAIYDPPPALYYRGSLGSGARRVAIVGSRGATPAGRSLARDLARGLSERGVEVVSGLARGIDGSAHEGALLGPSTTLAVLGSSVDIIYPAEHKLLAARIEARGAVISELPPGTPPVASQFPSRNRIIVGLSEAVIMVEAGSRSGALITARLALDEGRDVLAVPGRPAEPLAFGPNLMIRDGATLIRGLEDVLEHLGIESGAPKTLSSPPDKILDQLKGSAAKSIDQLAVDTGLAPPLLIARLSELELAGRVERLPGTLFRSAGPA